MKPIKASCIDQIIERVKAKVVPIEISTMKFEDYAEQYYFSSTFDKSIETYEMSGIDEKCDLELELKFACMNYPLLWHFLFIHFTSNLYKNYTFRSYYASEEESHKVLLENEDFYAESLPKNDRVRFLEDLSVIHMTFSKNENYLLEVHIVEDRVKHYIPWNDFILPELGRAAYERRLLMNDTIKPIEQPTAAIVNIWDKSNKAYIRYVAKAIYTSRHWTQEMQEIETKCNEHVLDNYVYNSHSMAPMINGTACVGKSTLVNKVLSHVRSNIDPSASIIKAGSLGGFNGKDSNQLLALQYQGVIFTAALTHFTSICDRCPINNLIWRIILQLMKTNGDVVDDLMHILDNLSPEAIRLWKTLPIVCIIDSNVNENRKRMLTRAESMGDAFRSLIEKYVPVQNMVYAVFATLLDQPLFNRANPDYISKTEDYIVKLMVKKIEKNCDMHQFVLPEIVPKKQKMPVVSDPDTIEKFQTAVKLHIFK